MTEHETAHFLTTAETVAFLNLHPRILESMRSANVDRDGSPYLTVAEAAAYLRLKPRTLDNMRCNGIGPIYSKHGGRICYSFVDIVAWSKARRRRSTAEKAP
jgi:Helix-turn-helix domain